MPWEVGFRFRRKPYWGQPGHVKTTPKQTCHFLKCKVRYVHCFFVWKPKLVFTMKHWMIIYVSKWKHTLHQYGNRSQCRLWSCPVDWPMYFVSCSACRSVCPGWSSTPWFVVSDHILSSKREIYCTDSVITALMMTFSTS